MKPWSEGRAGPGGGATAASQGLGAFIRLACMHRGPHFGVGQWPEGDGRAARVVPNGRVGLDVPIETKLHAPRTGAGWIERPGLVRYLARTATRLVLVDAPAGFGKTAVVAQWRCSAAENRPFGWVSLDRGDNDPARLWWYVISALQRACPELRADDILHELRARAPDIAGRVLPTLANELGTLSAPIVLVLDDYHVIKERAVHDQVAFLLLHLPPGAEVVLITRVDPPIPLARMRAAGEMAEIRARELRFTAGEAGTLVHAVADVTLSEPDLADLMERTEGWPAGLYLAALSLHGHPDPRSFVRQFTGNNRFIVDFLTEEVLSRQPAEMQQFLARTSILPRFCASLCDAVTGSADAAQTIELLERENLFLVPLDDSRQWYRYHHLFGQVLRSRLAVTEPGIVAALHERASTWYEQAGSAEEAIPHALAAGHASQAAALIARDWYPYANTGRMATLRGWMRALGDDQLAVNPLAAHVEAWAAAVAGDGMSVRRWLPVIETGDHEGPLPDGMRSLKSSAALLRGVFGFDGLLEMRESAVQAAALEGDPASPWYALARAALGFSLYLSGETAAAVAPLEEAVRSKASVPMIQMVALSALSMVTARLGRLAKAQELAEAARAVALGSDFGESPQGAVAFMAAGAVHAARGRVEEARAEFERALEARRKVPGISPWPTVEAMLLLAAARLDVGDRSGAAELAGEIRDILAVWPKGTQALQARLAELDRRLAGRALRVLLAEPLTEREIVVLRMLGGTLSLREIGQALYVSANTVKTHTRAIYRKLGVSTRDDAVARGKQLRLLAAALSRGRR